MKKFQKRVENFTCAHCGLIVKGTGYTDHCPECFYSQHIDINPGDRAANCGGLMKVINIELKNGQHILVYECEKCGYHHKNKVQKQDNTDKLIALQKRLAAEFAKN